MTDAPSAGPLQWLHGIASELEGLRTVAVQRLGQAAGLPSRDEFEVQRALLEDARGRLERLQAQVDTLIARLDRTPD